MLRSSLSELRPRQPEQRPAEKRTTASRAAAQLPPGLPRAGYRYRTTVAPASVAAPATIYREPLLETDDALLITPAYGIGSYLATLPGTPLLPGSRRSRAIMAGPAAYDYQGPYYGGP